MGLFFLGVVATVMSIWLMLLILVQRGKGGGLTGALGGMGGQSAFGSKAGDVFTKITVVSAIIWMTACLLIIRVYNRPIRPADTDNGSQASAMSAVDSDGNFDESVAPAIEENDPLDDLPALDDGNEEGDDGNEEGDDESAEGTDETVEGENDPELNGNQDDETTSTDPESNEGEQAGENESNENASGSGEENSESSEEATNQGEGGSGE